MPNVWFQFKQFRIEQDKAAFKVGTDSVLLGGWCNCLNANKALDVGSGTGILGLMVAQRNSGAKITAIEVDKESAQQAGDNFARSKFSDRIKIIQADFNHFWPDCTEKFDLIICNPPYFIRSKPSDSKNLASARHQQKLNYESLLEGAAQLLNENGILGVIFPFEYDAVFESLAKMQNLYCQRKALIGSQPGEKPIRVMGEWGLIQNEGKIEEMSFRAADNKGYSKEYIELTKDFYLNY